MQARRAARELAFILFSQFDKKITHYSKSDLEDIILKSVRILTSSATDELKIAVGALVAMRDQIDNYEADAEVNLNRPIGVANIPVPIPMTSDMTGRINEMIDIAEKSLMALEIAEFTTLDSQSEVKDYAVSIAEYFQKNHEEVDNIIQKYAKNWDLGRLVKMDKDILRIAIVELLYMKDAPMKVIVDEALELAKKYSTDDSASFINGILAKVIVDYGIN
ncbi:TPA: transcription antitermination factor NusB [Candidatus Gastranaerophilales bacterium HUM_20]|jgi:transcription antitermination factor nusB|nr:MAG: transcription antitermination factor NusB [Candidatus Melainabacteria bacterium 35_41]CDE89722.1 n utilization substance protein B homolog [Clostridium sp. CAG:729]DAB20276.1 MAG TPA: transcription antitermination factor NusB [Candidatus Gastranaerophilales bacterium HUM_20]